MYKHNTPQEIQQGERKKNTILRSKQKYFKEEVGRPYETNNEWIMFVSYGFE